MVDGAVLLVDATEGPLSQTKFVVEKALKRGLKPLVVLNKVDRPSATPGRCGEVESAAFDVFAALGADDEQLDFPVLYASARQGWASGSLPEPEEMPAASGMAPLLDALLAHVPAPEAEVEAPFRFLSVLSERDPYLGRVSTGRIASGRVRVGDAVKVIKHTGEQQAGFKVTRLFKRQGTRTLELEAAVAGDIVSIAGAPAAGVADTICDPAVDTGLPPGQVDPPTLSMVFSPNSSPLAGREGSQLTASKIGDRLRLEASTNVSLRVLPVEGGGGEAFEVQARGELQLGLLIGEALVAWEGWGRGGMFLVHKSWDLYLLLFLCLLSFDPLWPCTDAHARCGHFKFLQFVIHLFSPTIYPFPIRKHAARGL